MANNQIQASQLASVPLYTGAAPQDIDIWIESVDRARTTFGWDGPNTVAAAKSRLSEHAASWLHASTLSGDPYTTWDSVAVTGFKLALTARFHVAVNAIAAAEAIQDLQQKASETCDVFYDRVMIAIDKKNFTTTRPQKAADAYKASFAAETFVMFAAGLKQDIRELAMQGHNPPTTGEELRSAARNVEAQLRKKTSVHEVETDEQAAADAAKKGAKKGESQDPEVAALQKELHALRSDFGRQRGRSQSRGRGGRGGGRGGPSNMNNKCYNCGAAGHFARDCRSNQNRGGRGGGGYFRGGRGYGGPGGGGGGGRGGYAAAPAARPQFYVDQEPQHQDGLLPTPPKYDDYYYAPSGF